VIEPYSLKLPTQKTIEEAALRIKSYIHKTPVLSCSNINSFCGTEIYFKCENFQKAGAFKSRGAVNATLLLGADKLHNGVATHSSGNHAQALARAARICAIKAYIVMPENSPKVKINAVIHYGGQITFCKPTLEAREKTLNSIISDTSAEEIHPYNNYSIIAGQATCAKEIYMSINDVDVVIAPVGGGGLLSGTALSSCYFSPGTKIVAAEPEMADDAYRSFYQGKFIPSVNPKTIADGLLTSLGSITYPIIKKYVHQIYTVKEKTIITAMKLIWERMKIVVEPSAAVPLAAIIEHKTDFQNKRVAVILSGGNIDLNSLPWL